MNATLEEMLARLGAISESADCEGECIDWDKPTEKPQCPACIAQARLNHIRLDLIAAVEEAEASETKPVLEIRE